ARDEPVSTPVPRLDVPRPSRVVGERPSQLLDAGVQGVVADRGAVPDRREKLLARDGAPAFRDELPQHGGRLGRETNLLLSRPEPSGRRLEAERAEAKYLFHWSARRSLGCGSLHRKPSEIPPDSRDSSSRLVAISTSCRADRRGSSARLPRPS